MKMNEPPAVTPASDEDDVSPSSPSSVSVSISEELDDTSPPSGGSDPPSGGSDDDEMSEIADELSGTATSASEEEGGGSIRTEEDESVKPPDGGTGSIGVSLLLQVIKKNTAAAITGRILKFIYSLQMGILLAQMWTDL